MKKTPYKWNLVFVISAVISILIALWGILGADSFGHVANSLMKGIEPQSPQAVRFALRSSFMHWGVHPWACYGVMGLGLAYFQFRKKESAMVSNLPRPISGVGKGIKLLSNINLCFFTGLIIAAFLVSTKADILKLGGQGIVDLIVNFFPDSLRTSSHGDSTWIQNWRVFYWAWWLSWAPFVGVFIARISRGRTIREFVLGVMVIPSLVSFLWFTVFGNMALSVANHFTSQQLRDMAASPQTALFRIFGEYPGGSILSMIAIVLLVTFFVTSANSATFVLAMLTSRGALEPSVEKKTFWGILIAVLAWL